MGETSSGERVVTMSVVVQPITPVSIDVTTEARWFFEGALPDDVWAWFTAGTRGRVERRRDSYRHDDLAAIGVKRRFGTTLELKERQRAPEEIVLGDVVGRLEVWQRWSPADDRIDVSGDTSWIEVDKTAVKRRFDACGTEIELSDETRAMTGQGCDAEVVAVSVGGRSAWSIAFTGFGSPDDQRGHLLRAWDALMTPHPDVAHIDFGDAVPYGYPEWLIARADQSEFDPSIRRNDLGAELITS